MEKPKPRIRVKARSEGFVRAGGLCEISYGPARSLGDRIFMRLNPKNIFLIERLERSGDYQKYRVIYDR